MVRVLRACAIGLAVVLSFTACSASHASVIDFEGIPPAALVFQYNQMGVSFHGATVRSYATTPGFAHSGSQAAELCFAAEFCSSPLAVDFAFAQVQVSVWVGSTYAIPTGRTVVLKAFDANNVEVAQSSLVLPGNGQPTAIMRRIIVSAPSRVIRRVTLSYAAIPGGTYNNGLALDDMEFSAGNVADCPGTEFPALTVTSPADQSIVSANSILLSGQATTSSELIEAYVTVTSASGTRHVDLLGTLIDPAGGPFATQLAGILTEGANTLAFHLRNCRAPENQSRTVYLSSPPSGTKVRLNRLEVVQATQDLGNSVPLIAGKRAYVRAYLRADPTVTPIYGVTGDLVATRPDGTLAFAPVHSLNAVTLDSTPFGTQRVTLGATLNFELPPNRTPAGTYHFQLTNLKIADYVALPCGTCNNAQPGGSPLWSKFQATKPLNLILAPVRYNAKNLTPDILFTTSAALHWTNGAYPIAGEFPAGAGINLVRVLPLQETDLDVRAHRSEFLDTLSWITLPLFLDGGLPPQTKLLGLIPCACGGKAHINGRVAYADIGNLEGGPIPAADLPGALSYYGSVIAHEIAHLFGREHASNSHDEADGGDVDGNFPYPHGGIDSPGIALSTEWWRSRPYFFVPGMAVDGQSHVHDFMSYGRPQWISPYTYKALFNRFTVASPWPQFPWSAIAPSNQLVVVGHFERTGSAVVLPMFVTSARQGPQGAAFGKFRIELRDPQGRLLTSRQFEPERTSEGSGLAFAEAVPWHARTETVSIRRGSQLLFQRRVSRTAPRVADVRLSLTGNGRLVASWTASDADQDKLHALVSYRPDAGSPWLPVGSAAGDNKLGIDPRFMPGSSDGEVKVTVTDGVRSSEAIGRVSVTRHAPQAFILAPLSIDLKAGDPREISGAGYDAEDGLIKDRGLSWGTSNGGSLGTGPSVDLRRLIPGNYELVLRVADRDGQTGEGKIKVRIHP